MKKINLKNLIITVIVCLLPIIIGVLFYNKLPESVAIHWGINNNPNGYFSKLAFVFGLPIMMAVLQIFCCISSDLSDKNPEANKKAVTIFKWIIPILTIVLYIITIMYALGSNLDIRKIVMVILGIVFIVFGNYMPKVRGSYYINMKALWIKNKDEKLANRVIKHIAYMLIITGILCILSILFEPIISIIIVCISIIYTLVIYSYAYIKSREK